METKRISTVNKLAYASTDAAGNLLFCTLTSFILYFYTNVFGISIAVAGTVLLVARIFDTLGAPIWGFIIDHTHSKYGKSRPWFLWLAVPFSLFLVLSFLSPNLSAGQKALYAGVTYVLANFIYTGISTPITAILPNLSSNRQERIQLNSWRMIGGNVGYFVTASFTLPLVAFFGQGNSQTGFALVTSLYALVGCAMFLFAFAKTKELVAVQNEKSLSIKESIKAIKGNWPWLIVVSANLLYWIGNTVRGSTVIYYAQYNLGNIQYASVLNGLVLIQVIGVALIPFIVKKISKTHTFILGLLVAALGQIAIGFMGNHFVLVAICWSVAALGTGIAVSMPFAMLSDTVDYGEWKNGVRASGFLTAMGSAFCIQMGGGLGGFLPSMIMAKAGYVAGEVQSANSLAGINFSFVWLPAFIFVASAGVMLAYLQFEKNEEKIKYELSLKKA